MDPVGSVYPLTGHPWTESREPVSSCKPPLCPTDHQLLLQWRNHRNGLSAKGRLGLLDWICGERDPGESPVGVVAD